MRLFFDTSAFLKRYVDDPGSGRVVELMSFAVGVGSSALVLPESVSTLRRLVRENGLAEDAYCCLKEAILTDLANADICDLTPTVMEHSIRSFGAQYAAGAGRSSCREPLRLSARSVHYGRCASGRSGGTRRVAGRGPEPRGAECRLPILQP